MPNDDRSYLLRVLGFVTVSLLVIAQCALKPKYGSDPDYLVTMVAFVNHGSPDMRDQDVVDAGTILDRSQIKLWPTQNEALRVGFFETRSHRFYAYHFFLYSLLNLPAFALLRALGGNELRCFPLTNAALFIAANAMIWLGRAGSSWRRLTFAGLASITPVILYVGFSGPEMACWSFVVLGLECLNRRWTGLSTLFISLAASHNPPLVIFGLYAFAIGFDRSRPWKTIVSGAGLLLAFTPNAYYYALFSTSSLIVRSGAASPAYVSAGRIWSMLFDLNQGMIVYTPGLVLLFIVLTVRGLTQRDRTLQVVGILAVTLIAMAGCTATSNWNCSCRLMMRYTIWILPWFAWCVAELAPESRNFHRLIIAILAFHTLIFAGFSVGYLRDPEAFWPNKHLPQAEFVLRHFPHLYNPEFEIFAERTNHVDAAWQGQGTICYAAPDGSVTKALVDPSDLDALPQRYQISEAYREMLRAKSRGSSGCFYVEPPKNVWKIKP